jgi:SPP1 gp7 family putative phage head morphogenesis protein
LTAVVGNVLIEGAPSAEWWSRQDKVLKNKFADRIRQGFLRGDSTGSIVAKIRGTNRLGLRDGIMKKSRQQVTALVRTSIQTVSNDARLAAYAKNEIIENIQWSSTFDDKTTIICAELDGMMWNANTLEPVGDAIQFPGPIAHWQCRSNQIPVTVSWEKLATKNKKLAKQLDKKLSEGTKSSMGGYIDAPVRYPQWLKDQPVSTQVKVLGKKKQKLWSEGKLSFKELVDETARPISLSTTKKAPKKKLSDWDDEFAVEAKYLREQGQRVPHPELDFDSLDHYAGWIKGRQKIRKAEQALLKAEGRPDPKSAKQFMSELWDSDKPRNFDLSHHSHHFVRNTGNDKINGFLRGSISRGEMSVVDRSAVKALTGKWDDLSHPTKRKTTLYRGISVDEDAVAKWKVGDRIDDKGFWSTSANREVAVTFADETRYPGNVSVVMEIDVPKGTKLWDPAYHIPDGTGPSVLSSEFELVLKNGSSVQIVGIEEIERRGVKMIKIIARLI